MGLKDLIEAGRIIFGCGQLHRIGSGRVRRRLVQAALHAGIREFDVAPAYGNGLAERVLGDVLGGCEERVLVHSKAGIPIAIYPDWSDRAFPLARLVDLSIGRHRASYDSRRFGSRYVGLSVRGSLRRLGVGRLETLFLHEPLMPFSLEEWTLVRSNLEELVASGAAVRWGIAGPVLQYGTRLPDGCDIPVVQQPLLEALTEFAEVGSIRACERHHVYGVARAARSVGREFDVEAFVTETARTLSQTRFILSSSRASRVAGWGGSS